MEKNPVHQTWNFKLENVKNQVQINRVLVYSGSSHLSPNAMHFFSLRHSVYIRKVSSYLLLCSAWSGAESKCAVNVALPKMPNLDHKSRWQALRAYWPTDVSNDNRVSNQRSGITWSPESVEMKKHTMFSGLFISLFCIKKEHISNRNLLLRKEVNKM